MKDTQYQIGYNEGVLEARTGKIKPMWITYRPVETQAGVDKHISVYIGSGRFDWAKMASPQEILKFRPYHFFDKIVDGQSVADRMEQEPPGWFERKCREANCEWFVPMVKRMAAGEDVPLEEIQAAYLKHNGQPMPCGEWAKLFR
jgi:hypothetical protein